MDDLEDYHKSDAENYHINAYVLRNGSTFINRPPGVFEGIVIAKCFDSKSHDSIYYEH